MYPFIHIGSTSLPSYGILISIGFLIGIIIVFIRSKSYQFHKAHILLSFIFILIGLIVGAKIVHALSLLPTFIQNWDLVTKYPLETVLYSLSGWVFYGGLIGAVVALKLFCFQFDKPFGKFINLYTPMIPLVHAIGRVGCFLSGCCYGIEYHGPFAIHFPDYVYVEQAKLVSRFPVQLLESFLNIVLFVCLLLYEKKNRKEYSVFGIYLISYAIIRFCVEFLRGDMARGIFLGLSTSQWISLLIIPIGIYMLKRKKYPKTERTKNG